MPKILVIRCGRLGDSILTFPAISALEVLFPKSEIHILTEERTASLFLMHKSVRHVFSVPALFYKRPSFGRLLSILKVVFRLRREKFQYVFDLQDQSWGTALIARFVTRQSSVGFKNFKNGICYHFGVYGKGYQLQGTIEPMALSYLRVVAFFNQSQTENLYTRFAETTLAIPENPKRQENNNFCFFHLGANEIHKTWSQERFWELATLLRQHGHTEKIIFSVGEKDVKEFESQVTSRKLTQIEVWTTNSIVELAKKIRDSTYFLSTDTGPSHIASNLNVPRIILCQPNVNMRIWYGHYSTKRCIYISALREKCRNCTDVSRQCNNSCVDNIPTESVFQTILNLKKLLHE